MRAICISCGHRDNYVDAATYIAIAFECDATEDEGKKT